MVASNGPGVDRSAMRSPNSVSSPSPTRPASLAGRVGEGDDTEFGDLIADRSTPGPFEATMDHLLPAGAVVLLSAPGATERQVLRLRYGLDRGEPRTLDEVGDVLSLSGERI